MTSEASSHDVAHDAAQLREALDAVELSVKDMRTAVLSAGLLLDPATFNFVSNSLRQVQEDLAHALLIAERF